MPSRLQHGLIVSCQAAENDLSDSSQFIVAFAEAAEIGGAVRVRIRGAANIKAVRKAVRLPIIGITKTRFSNAITRPIEIVKRFVNATKDL
jgi:N-acylglucosamine-6-phosphate 2-epimerase